MKSYLLLLLACMLSCQVFAQDNDEKKVYFGVRGGANIANLTKSHGDARTDVYVGGFFNLRATEVYNIQFELDYSRQGANNVLERTSVGNKPYSKYYTTDIDVSYVNLKVINKFQMNEVNFLIGGGIGGLLNGDKEKYNNIDFLFVLGVGYDITKNIGVEARWQHGLYTINKTYSKVYDQFTGPNEVEYSYYYENNIRNNVFQLGVYYKF
ncbi:MAG: PorT family protein [Flavobacteriaceae bacterium]|jgi:opacity protein-like surface antigen|nr:PorT family protein [Flavobacteriaceae bacterium]